VCSSDLPLPEVRFCPTGGINEALAPSYLALDNVLCVGGSWVVPRSAMQIEDWATITRRAKEASTGGRFAFG